MRDEKCGLCGTGGKLAAVPTLDGCSIRLCKWCAVFLCQAWRLEHEKRQNEVPIMKHAATEIMAAPRANGEAAQKGKVQIFRPHDSAASDSPQLPPLAAELEGLAVSLGELAGSVGPEQWAFIALVRENMRALAESVGALEKYMVAPNA